MRYLDEYRDPDVASRLLERIRAAVTRPWVIMEVCGGQTHSIVRYGVDRLLPEEIELVHGPGCPVCVTALETIDRAHAIAERPEVIFTSFGDMLRVPGSHGDLLGLKARGADVRVVYSPLDALALARRNPDRQVVFFGIGFETTAPANAMALVTAKREGVKNFSLLVSHVLVPPAIAWVLQAPDNRVQAFLGPGHVCAVVGSRPYGQAVWTGKPAAVMSTSMGGLGGVGANHHLRQALSFFDMPLLQQPEAYVGNTGTLFDDDGHPVSEQTEAFFKGFVDAFGRLIERNVQARALAA